MEEVSCILCGTRSSDVAIVENGFTGVKCHNCNLIYISPRPNPTDITRLYTDEHAVLYADAQFQFDKFNKTEAARTLANIRNLKKGGALLELGPGGGFFLSEARKCGYDPYGIELNPIEARWINEGLQIPCETTVLNAQSFGGRRFDVIYHKDVLSHLANPLDAFQQMHRALKSDGLLVFETGNIADVDKKYMKYFSQFSYPDHLFFFGERSLNILLEKAGFTARHIDREPIMLQLMLQKALWWLKDFLKEPKVVQQMALNKGLTRGNKALSTKRQLRNLYRYVQHYLVRCGAFLPKQGRPLKLVTFAQKTEVGRRDVAKVADRLT